MDSENKKPIWFKRKTYGWGWTPSTWQGWVILAGWMVLFGLGILVLNKHAGENPSLEATITFFLYTSLLVAILIKLCYAYGESPRWQWGEKKDSSIK